jgi:UDP-galactose transporter
VGVAIVQVSGSGDKHNKAGTPDHHTHRFIGLVAVLCAACTSGFAGVYFEKILKGSQTTLWLRNIQMGLPSIVIAFITIYSKDSKAVAEHGILGGFSSMVWTVVTVQAAGGLIVAVVVKYADNVLKVFATSFSIVISCIISAIWFDFHATFLFVVGAALVVAATVMYSAPEGRLRTHRKPVLPVTSTSSNGPAARRSLVM